MTFLIVSQQPRTNSQQLLDFLLVDGLTYNTYKLQEMSGRIEDEL